MAGTMITSGITNSPIIGINNFHVAKMLTDVSGSTPTYEDPISIPWLRKVEIKPQNNSVQLYADNQSVATSNVMANYQLTIEMAGVPLEYKALLLGHNYDNTTGIMTVNKEDAAPYFEIMFESTKQNGKKRFVKFTKVQFSEPDESNSTKEENITYSSPSMTATAIYRTSDGVALKQADEEASGYVASTGSSWFTTAD